MLCSVFLHSCHSQSAGRLGDGPAVLKNVLHGGTDFIGTHRDDVVYRLLDQFEGLLARLGNGATVGKQAHLF